ncbi:hypothetical protein FQA47_013885 [Oryzias melastigma]|uniref:Uncharacterized protein n=1 Tax=Oryzias melastigma TaxID=30732 RepID=A0A834BN89_ORYME|nr:hypothetical protein FQA47_013885 [Oryzias melastigma]
MFRPSYKRSSTFSLLDPDMWDTKSDFAAQTSRWCGTSSVSGSESQSKASASSESFRWNDPSLRRWQSLSRLAPDNVAWPTSSPLAELRAARSQRIFPQMDVLLWLQDAQEHMDSQLDWFSTRDLELNNTAPPYIFDSKQKSFMKSKWNKMCMKENLKNVKFLMENVFARVLRLEKDLLQMRSALNKESRDQPSSFSYNKEKHKSNTNLSEMREALREAEAKAAGFEEQGNKTLRQLQTAAETQRSMQDQMDEMNKRLSQTVQNHAKVRDELSEANNKISQACLEKAVLSTQVLKLEDAVTDLTAKLTTAQSDRESLIQEKNKLLQRVQVNSEGLAQRQEPSSQNTLEQETFQMKAELKALREENQKLRGELQVVKQNLDVPKPNFQGLKEETKRGNSKEISDLKEQTDREKEKLLNERKKDLLETKDQCCQRRESVDILEKEKQKLQEHLQLLEAQVEEKESRFLLQEEEYRKQDAARVQSIEKLKAVASHWAEKWQKVALTLKNTQDEFDEFKRNASEEKDSDSLLRAELEQERSRGRVLLQQPGNKGVDLEQTIGKEQVAKFSGSMPSDSQSGQSKPPQSSDVERLRKKLTERERELSDKEHSLRSLEKLRETERTESQMKISALELELNQMSENGQNHGGLQVEDSISDSLRLQLDESRKRAEELEREKMLVVKKLQALRQQLSVADRHCWHQGSGLVTLFEEDEESAGSTEEEEEDAGEPHTEGTHANSSFQFDLSDWMSA